MSVPVYWNKVEAGRRGHTHDETSPATAIDPQTSARYPRPGHTGQRVPYHPVLSGGLH